MKVASCTEAPTERGPEVKIVTHAISDWPSVRPIWLELVEASQCSFFLTASWIETWLEIFGTQLDSSILVVQSEGRAVGACLLVMRKLGIGIFSMKGISINASGEPAADTTYTEFNDILSRSGWEGLVADAVLDHLKKLEWEELVLDGFCQGKAYETLKAAFPTFICEENSHASHYVDLESLRQAGRPYESVLASKARKHLRQNIRYFSETGPILLQSAENVTDALAMLDELAELSKARCRAKGRRPIFSSRRFFAFHKRLVGKCLDDGAIKILRVSAANQTIGILYNLVHRGKVYFYQCGYQYSSDKRLSPGKVALALAIQYYLDAGYKEFDFLSGGANYKEWMSTGFRTLNWLNLRKRGIKFEVLSAVQRIKSTV